MTKIGFLLNILLLSVISVSGQPDTVIAQQYLNIAWDYRNTNSDSLLFYGNLATAASNNWPSGLSQGYTRKAIAFKQKGVIDSATIYYLKAIEIRKNIGPSVKLINTYNNYAIFLKDFGNYNKALSYSLEAYALALKGDSSILIADIAMTIGSTYRRLKEYRLASNYYSIADSLYKIRGSKNDKALLDVNISNLLNKMQRPNEAIHLLNHSILTLDELNNNLGLAIAYNSLGEAYITLQNIDSAKIAFQKSLEFYNGLKNIPGQTTAYINLASVQIINNNYAIATPLLYTALSLARQTNDIDALIDISSEFIKYYLIENTADSVSKYIGIKDSLENEVLNKIKMIEISEKSMQFELVERNLTIQNQQLNIREKEKRIYYMLIIFLILLSICIIYITRIYHQKEIQKKQAQIQSKQIQSILKDQELKSISTMLEAQETERKRIAEDLHDRVGSILSTVKLYFNSLDNKMDSYQQENHEQYTKANKLLDDAVHEVRQISHNLVSGILMQFGLVPALRDLCTTIEGAGQLKASLNLHGLDERIESAIEIAVYRIIQELISNTMKHAKATEITISLTRLNHHLNIMVEDNGKGFDTQAINSGIGLKNIRSRVEKLSGKINFDSVIGRGTIVIVEIPV